MPLYLQGHTLEIAHVVSQAEVENVCRIFKIPETDTIQITMPQIMGLNEINIHKNPIKENGMVTRYIYRMKVQINIGRLLKKSNVSMVDLTKSNVEAMIKKLSSIFSKKLYLQSKNSNAEEWIITRVDVGIDLKLGTDRLEVLQSYMRLLHKTFITTNGKNCRLRPYKGYDQEKVKSESITIENGSYSYNIYIKIIQWLKKYGDSASQEELEEIRDVIRVEKQLEGKGLNELGAGKKFLSLLLNEITTCNLMAKIIGDLKSLFGVGIHVSDKTAMQIIDRSLYSDIEKLKLKYFYSSGNIYGYDDFYKQLVNNFGVDEKSSKTLINSCRKKIEVLGIAVIGLSDGEIELIGEPSLESLPDKLEKLFTMSKTKRSRGRFGQIRFDDKNNRHKCNFTLHSALGKGKRTSAASKTIEDTEMKILEKIKDNFNDNLSSCNNDVSKKIYCSEIVMQELRDFLTVATGQKTIIILNDCIQQVERKIVNYKIKIKEEVGQDENG